MISILNKREKPKVHKKTNCNNILKKNIEPKIEKEKCSSKPSSIKFTTNQHSSFYVVEKIKKKVALEFLECK